MIATHSRRRTRHGLLVGLALLLTPTSGTSAEVIGLTVTPHMAADALRYRRPRDPALAARVQLFVRGAALPGTFAGKTPAEWLQAKDWAWHDLGTARKGPEESLSVWTFNGKSARWGVGQSFEVQAEGLKTQTLAIQAPQRWISAVTFLSTSGAVHPDTIVLHVVNASDQPLALESLRVWLPKKNTQWQTLWPQEKQPLRTVIPAREREVVRLTGPTLPLTYAALEVKTSAESLWTHLRIKRETFDISGGWIGDRLTEESYLNLLSSLHINTGHIEAVPGLTDDPKRSQRHPLKLFHRLWPLEKWDTDEWLPRIHAVEFLGEPQYGGGRPMPPQEVFDKLLPYRVSRLPTSVTHSEERIWRWYAGLSDYPHYDAYRVVAPAADAWTMYDRWGGQRLRWGAPLETIGDLSRSLRELNRPLPCAYWSQGPHHDWGGGFGGGGRARRSPTPDELRSQALHALSTRITSLYWFNLSLKSLLMFPDTWQPLRRVGREIKMLAPYYLEGDAHHFERRRQADGTPDWDLASIVTPEVALLFALDTAYTPDPKQNVFVFGPPRRASFSFPLPHWLQKPKFVYRVDAEGVHDVQWSSKPGSVVIEDTRSQDGIYLATHSPTVRQEIEQRRQAALKHEAAYPVEEAKLRALLR